MANQYYKKDIHKSIEGLLTGLYVYQYLLDTSTSGLILRYIVQDITNALVLFDLRKSGTNARRSAVNAQGTNGGQPNGSAGTSPRTLHNRSAAAAATSTPHTSNTSSQSVPQHPGVNGGLMTPREVPAASSSRAGTQVSNSQVPAQASSLLFEYTPQNNNSDQHNSRDDAAEGYYVDEEETRHSLDNPPRNQTRHSTVGQGSSSTGGSGTDSGSASDNSDSDEDDPLGGDYEEILEQETFVVQLHFQDMVSYLFSNQEAFSFPRIALSAGSAAAEAEAMRVQNLPV
ncbi:hypothetical protein BGX26_005362 [Mortierella sp. AD094]|nr:hypothetical protein BGX26_005362 [Mortierella sp. AD094]